ncbi:MAG: cyclopropane-fatty-acyl-phospholipid synthase [Alphaproteobacteria bacterium]|nr:cyclopropane-fatty-acyl-phospholipid synthase [Alphaproteobacteria bacterium]
MFFKKKFLPYVAAATLLSSLGVSATYAASLAQFEEESKEAAASGDIFRPIEEHDDDYMSKPTIDLQELDYVPRQVLSILSEIEIGSIKIKLPEFGNRFLKFEGSVDQDKYAIITINDLGSFSSRLSSRGEVGLGESYELGEWDAFDVRRAAEVFRLNHEVLGKALEGNCCNKFAHSIYSFFTESSKGKAVDNIQAHYDLGNPFYRPWLDSSMTYSCALYDYNGRKAMNLEQAQQNKYQRILDRLNATSGSKILEIGCGWGGFAEFAAARGHYVTGITLSEEQVKYSNQRAIDKGFADKATFRLQDYRDVTVQYDNVVSIGMFEHVGEKYWGEFFVKVHDCLKPGKKAMLHTMVDANEENYDKRTKELSWLMRYIFPGGQFPTPERIIAEARNASLQVNDVFQFGKDYTKTLAAWSDKFHENWNEIQTSNPAVFDERFKRRWEYYLDGGSGTMESGAYGLYHFELQKPLN